MKSLPTVLALTGVLLTSATAAADENAMTAGDLQQLCLGSDTTSKNVCRIYILGVVQGIEVGLNMRGRRPCVPATTSAESLQQTIKSKLDEDLTAVPSDKNLVAAGIIGGIVARAFPCH
jgi:Rap1a immunity proteins